MRPLLLAVFLATFFFIGNGTFTQAQTKKLAFVVGVSEYQKAGLTDLQYAHKDAEALSAELTNQGFEVTSFIGDEALTEKVREGLTTFIEETSRLRKEDIVLLSFSGHGVQKMVKQDGRIVETPFVCLQDTLVSNLETMISLNWVLEQLKLNSGCNSNLLIVDACRNNPDKGARTLDGGTVTELPTKISMLFSSSPGQKSYESEKVEQGVFSHVLLKGLQGEARDRRGKIGWLQLASYVQSELPYAVEELMDSQDIQQRANLVGNLTTSALLAYPAADEAYAELLKSDFELLENTQSLATIEERRQSTAGQYLEYARRYRNSKAELDAVVFAILFGNDKISAEAADIFIGRFRTDPQALLLVKNLNPNQPTQRHLNFLSKLEESSSNSAVSNLVKLARLNIFRSLREIKVKQAFDLIKLDEISPDTNTLLATFSDEELYDQMRDILRAASNSDSASFSEYEKENLKKQLFRLENLSVGKMAPDIEGEDLNGKKFKLSEYRGKVIVLDFWADW